MNECIIDVRTHLDCRFFIFFRSALHLGDWERETSLEGAMQTVVALWLLVEEMLAESWVGSKPHGSGTSVAFVSK